MPDFAAGRHSSRYFVYFVDHKTNYVRVFQRYDQAAKKFDSFLIHFEKHFECRLHVFRTDGGGEYAKQIFYANNGSCALSE